MDKRRQLIYSKYMVYKYYIVHGIIFIETMAQINIKIDDNLKQDAIKPFSSMGLDLSTGIKLYLKRVTQDNKLPFTPRQLQVLIRPSQKLIAVK